MASIKDLEAALAQAKAENEVLKAAAASRTHFTLKVSPKGAVSVYGLGRFPVTLYKGQWNRLIENIGAVKTFIADHGAQLKDKEAVTTAPAATTAPAIQTK